MQVQVQVGEEGVGERGKVREKEVDIIESSTGLLLRDLLRGMGSGEDHINGSRIIPKKDRSPVPQILLFCNFLLFIFPI